MDPDRGRLPGARFAKRRILEDVGELFLAGGSERGAEVRDGVEHRLDLRAAAAAGSLAVERGDRLARGVTASIQLERFDVAAVYDKRDRTLELAATVTPELIPEPD